MFRADASDCGISARSLRRSVDSSSRCHPQWIPVSGSTQRVRFLADGSPFDVECRCLPTGRRHDSSRVDPRSEGLLDDAVRFVRDGRDDRMSLQDVHQSLILRPGLGEPSPQCRLSALGRARTRWRVCETSSSSTGGVARDRSAAACVERTRVVRARLHTCGTRRRARGREQPSAWRVSHRSNAASVPSTRFERAVMSRARRAPRRA